MFVLTKTRVLIGSKVDRADFETGDEIFAINGQQIAEMTRDDLLSYLYQVSEKYK